MHDYIANLTELQENFSDLIGDHLKNAYTDGVRVAEQYLITLNALSHEISQSALSRARGCILEDNGNKCRMFGLFVYALLYGISRGRHLHRHRRILNAAYSEMLDDLRLFMEIHSTIELDYAQFWHLPANERAKLHALLEDEGLLDKESGYIGGNLF